jgi:methylthioribose-1-phosphate isomerase
VTLTREPGDSIYLEGGTLHVLDQTLLPTDEVFLELSTPEEVVEAIKRLAVRGAPAIGIAGAYGVLLGAMSTPGDAEAIRAATLQAIDLIGASRPTARNLFWAVEGLRRAADEVAEDVVETDLALVEVGQELVFPGAGVLTHCNSGPLAALRYGTALGVLIEAHRLGKGIHVYVDETRPLLQGSRLTAWELGREGVPYTLIPDNTAAVVMKQGRVDMVMTGADRIAANGDSANKIGTYGLAVLARAHGIPFYIAAPGSTVDLECPSEPDIVIEERDPEEVRRCGDRQTAPPSAPVFNPAFDVTPASFIHAIVTDKGVLRPPYEESLQVFR